MGNPNNCSTCEYKQPKCNSEKGHCYMFRDEPTSVCMKRPDRIDDANDFWGQDGLGAAMSDMAVI